MYDVFRFCDGYIFCSRCEFGNCSVVRNRVMITVWLTIKFNGEKLEIKGRFYNYHVALSTMEPGDIILQAEEL